MLNKFSFLLLSLLIVRFYDYYILYIFMHLFFIFLNFTMVCFGNKKLWKGQQRQPEYAHISSVKKFFTEQIKEFKETAIPCFFN